MNGNGNGSGAATPDPGPDPDPDPDPEQLTGAAIRALGAAPGIVFRGHRAHEGRRPLPRPAPHLRHSPGEDTTALRGVADGLALRLTRTDAALHARMRPEQAVERLLFDALEQFRAESLAPATRPGTARNLRERHALWARGFHQAGLTEGARGLLLYTALEMCRSRLTGQPVLAATEDLIEATRGALGPALGHALAGLRRHRHDQAAYAPHALAVAEAVAALLEEAAGEGEEDGSADEESPFSLLLEDDPAADADGTGQGGTAGSTGQGPGHAQDAYRVFTTAHDQERAAGGLLRAELAREYRGVLDTRIRREGLATPRLARRLHALLATPAPDGWDGGHEEGRLDARQLARLVVSPTERNLYRAERAGLRTDAAVTFLVDCSGSMKRHREHLAARLDVWARALEHAGAACEILGFTTASWNGGRARRDWLRAGRPPHPGRVAERLHLVFKDGDTSYRRARPGIAALLKADLYREGIGGEAVEWAAARLRARAEARRVLLVLSDGGLAQGPSFLDAHLKEVAARTELELYGLPVEGDLTPYFAPLPRDFPFAPFDR
ncbi:cobaltochelatase CobT-related protein [Streptomyces iconiensis]|uniref:Cobalt chelatase n=1 Tax=Streptomyces iconiensis TaxID=1384038 RepID=A0ABT7A2T3_9ACTN|nr:cobalt chelatase [Streptomyces iconiensis]MDJ1134923.1 cobalt chelatase [Streptomyces iconiensis]